MTRSRAGRVCLVAFLIAVSATGCHRSLNAAGEKLDPDEARRFSNDFVGLIVADKPADIWQKMEARLRRDLAETQMRATLDRVYAQYGGKPLEAEYKSESSGEKVYLDGTTKPMRKFWYAVRTETHAKGKYYLFVEVVPDAGRLACTGFSIVSFPGGPPPELR